MDVRFKNLEDQYFRLKGELTAKRITPEQFERALKEQMFQDSHGRYWMLGVDDAKWYVHDGQNWIKADPPAAGQSAVPDHKPFLLPVQDVFSIQGKTIVTGRVERGSIRVGEAVEIVAPQGVRDTVVAGVEMFQKQLDLAQAGDNVALWLRGVAKDDVQPGHVVAEPGTIAAHEIQK